MGDATLTLDPAWPWSIPGLGLPTLAVVAGLVAALTLWTYRGVPRATAGRLGLIVLLRLLALLVILLVCVRPSLGVPLVEGLEASQLLVILDRSESMQVKDEFNGASRWERARRLWASPAVAAAAERLAREQKIELVKYEGGEDLRISTWDGEASGKRTDVGLWLQELGRAAPTARKWRAIFLFSDGIDNGARFPAVEQARRLRDKCPIYTFGLGNPDDFRDRKDIALTKIEVGPPPIPVKTKMNLKVALQAPGFQDAVVKLSVWAQDSSGKEPVMLDAPELVTLKSAKEHEIALTRDAPDKADEYKITVKIEPLPDEADQANNQISTYVPITKEGVSILWIEAKKRPYEPAFVLRYALASDRRFRVDYAEVPAQTPSQPDWLQLDSKNYDVIVLGDLTAERLKIADPQAPRKIADLVAKKTGLMMLGGYDTFAAGGWASTPLGKALPVTMDRAGQDDRPGRVQLTDEGKARTFLQLSSDPKKSEAIWSEHFRPLDGMPLLGKPAQGASVLATRVDEPALVASTFGLGRVLAFAPDTTWLAWRNDAEAVGGFNRFWKQTMLWLAHQDEAGGNLWVTLDRRRVLAHADETMTATFGLRGKAGNDLPGASFTAKILGPGNEEFQLPTEKEENGRRGTFAPTKAGEYQLIVTAKALDADGSELDERRTARFLVIADDIEKQNTIADHEFLTRLAAAAGGHFAKADELLLLQSLEQYKGQVAAETRTTVHHWPDWRAQPPSERTVDQFGALWQSGSLGAFAAFVLLLTVEWTLRRLWGWV